MPHKSDGSDRYGHYAEDMSDVLEGKSSKIEKNIWRFALPDDPILQGDPYRQHLTNRQIPAQSLITADGGIGTDIGREFLEFHFYSKDTHQLQLSINVPLDKGYLWIRDSTRLRRNLGAYPTMQLGLELWRSHDDPDPSTPDVNERDAYTDFYQRYLTDENGQDLLPAGYYNVIINVFSSELGEHDDYYWEIDEVSAERKELRLKPIDETHLGQFEVGQFADQSIFQTDFVDVLDEITKRKELGQVAPGITSAILSSTEGLYTSIADDIITEIQRLDDVNGTATMTYINGEGLRQMVEAAIKQTFTDIMVDMKAVNRNLPKGTQDVPEKRFRMTKAFFEAAVGKVADNIITDALVASRFPDSDGEDRLFVNQ